MSKWTYVVQTALIASVLFALVRRQHTILAIQVIVWAVGVIGIWWRYGEAQLGFYSNDQLHYVSVVRILTYESLPTSFEWWISFSKIPYPATALPLALIGIHLALALKTVSIIFLLALTNRVLRDQLPTTVSRSLSTIYLTGCGTVGTLFSMLALRETLMMYLVYRYSFDRSPVTRIVAIVLLFLLRSHLAAALLVAEVLSEVWKVIRTQLKLGYFEVVALVVLGVTFGLTLFSWRIAGFGGLRTPFGSDWTSSDLFQIASNFAGLQFLTTHEAFVKLSVADLLLLRIPFSETFLIPLGFSVACLIFGPRLNQRHRYILLAFSIYVSIVTNTDFNSFRQNIPFMPLMGIVILEALNGRRLRHAKQQEVNMNTDVPIACR